MSVSLTAIAQLIAALIGGAGITALVQALFGRRKIQAEATDMFTDSVTGWAKEVKADATEARDRAKALNAELDTVSDRVSDFAVEVRSLAYELDEAFAKLRRWKQAINDDDITRDQLRAMVDADFPHDYPPPNGGTK